MESDSTTTEGSTPPGLPTTIDPAAAVRAFKSQRPLTLKLIRYCLPAQTNSLYSEGMISEECYEIACNDNQPVSKRAMALLDCIETRLQFYPADFAKLIRLMESEPYLAPVVKGLLESYRAIISTASNTSSQPLLSSSSVAAARAAPSPSSSTATAVTASSSGKVGASGRRVEQGDVSFLLDFLCNYAYKWEELGLSLGFLNDELMNILHSSPNSPVQQHLRTVLAQWAHWPTADHPVEPTIVMLCDALRSKLVELGDVADSLYQEFKK